MPNPWNQNQVDRLHLFCLAAQQQQLDDGARLGLQSERVARWLECLKDEKPSRGHRHHWVHWRCLSRVFVFGGQAVEKKRQDALVVTVWFVCHCQPGVDV